MEQIQDKYNRYDYLYNTLETIASTKDNANTMKSGFDAILNSKTPDKAVEQLGIIFDETEMNSQEFNDFLVGSAKYLEGLIYNKEKMEKYVEGSYVDTYFNFYYDFYKLDPNTFYSLLDRALWLSLAQTLSMRMGYRYYKWATGMDIS